MFRSVWDQIHCSMDAICLHRTDSNLNSIVPYGITFISGPIWYQRADLIQTGSTWSHVKGLPIPISYWFRRDLVHVMLHKPLAFRDIGYIKFQIFLTAISGIFVGKLTFYAFCYYHFSIIYWLLKPHLLYFCNSSVVGVSFHLLLLCLLCLDISGRRNHY